MTDPKTIAEGLTEAQRDALIKAITLLDHFAGEGAGMLPNERMGETLFADDVMVDLMEAFVVDVKDHDPLSSILEVLGRADHG